MFKIGFTDRPVGHRAGVIQSHSPLPLRIIGDIAGDMATERSFHRRLSPFRKHGEWFHLPEEVLWEVLRWFGHPDAVPSR